MSAVMGPVHNGGLLFHQGQKTLLQEWIPVNLYRGEYGGRHGENSVLKAQPGESPQV